MTLPLIRSDQIWAIILSKEGHLELENHMGWAS
jgi:hypothetical protein